MKDFSEINDLVESVECRMQDAYEQGYETGYKDGKRKGEQEDYHKGYIDGQSNGYELVEQQYQEGYKKGLKDAWECARKINDLKVITLEELFPGKENDNIFADYSTIEAMQKLKMYEERQNIKAINVTTVEVGDEVRRMGNYPESDYYDGGIVTLSSPGEVYVMHKDGSVGREDPKDLYRVGRNFPQIKDALEQLRGDE